MINNDWSCIYFCYAPNTCSHCTAPKPVWHRTYTTRHAPLWRSAQGSFTPLQISRRNRYSYWWKEALRYDFLAGAKTIRYNVDMALFCITRKMQNDENALIAVVKWSFVMSSVTVLTKKKEKKTLLKVKLIFREERELRSKRPVAIPSISSIANSPLQNPNQ